MVKDKSALARFYCFLKTPAKPGATRENRTLDLIITNSVAGSGRGGLDVYLERAHRWITGNFGMNIRIEAHQCAETILLMSTIWYHFPDAGNMVNNKTTRYRYLGENK